MNLKQQQEEEAIWQKETENEPDFLPSFLHTKIVECSGRAKEVLKIYRTRVHELKATGQANADMVACKELGMPPRQHGELRGVPIGLSLKGRGEAAILGIHETMLRGIDALKGKPCYAICISGRYVDDDDSRDDGKIIYTGEGGQDKTGWQVEDQSDQRVGNQALIRSYQTGKTVRVLRGRACLYQYLGLYRCTDCTFGPGKHGRNVFRFTLTPISGTENQCPLARSLPMPLKVSPRSRIKKARVNTLPELVTSSSSSSSSITTEPPFKKREDKQETTVVAHKSQQEYKVYPLSFSSATTGIHRNFFYKAIKKSRLPTKRAYKAKSTVRDRLHFILKKRGF